MGVTGTEAEYGSWLIFISLRQSTPKRLVGTGMNIVRPFRLHHYILHTRHTLSSQPPSLVHRFAMSTATSFYELKAEKPRGELVDFKDFEGKASRDIAVN